MEGPTGHNDWTLVDNAEILATQWMSVKQLEDAGELLNGLPEKSPNDRGLSGIPIRKGAFTKEEVEKTEAAIKMYQKENNLDDEQLDDLMHTSQPSNGFWTHIARAVPQRGVKSVFYHVRRAHDSLARAGKWTAAEDEQLRKAVQAHGSNWVAVADLVQRTPADCSDRFRQHTQFQDKRRGAWSLEEEGQLLRAIEDLAQEGKSNMSGRGYWVSVSKAMGATRTPKQCQSKWSESLEGKIKNEGKIRRWKEDDSYILIYKIASLDVDSESDINWKSLSDPMWNMWSSHCLQSKWKYLKASLNNADGVVGHRDVVHGLVAWIATKRPSPTGSTPIIFIPSSPIISTPSSPSPPSTSLS